MGNKGFGSIGIVLSLVYGTLIFADSTKSDPEACEKRYKELQDEYWAYEQSTRAELYDYIETGVDYDNYVKALKNCTAEHDSVKAIRTCVKAVEKEFPY